MWGEGAEEEFCTTDWDWQKDRSIPLTPWRLWYMVYVPLVLTERFPFATKLIMFVVRCVMWLDYWVHYPFTKGEWR